MSGALDARPHARDTFEAELFAQLERLREELNWFYSRIDRPVETARGADAMHVLHDSVRERETRTLEIMRQLQQHGEQTFARVAPPDLEILRRELGAETALVEYASLDGQLLAFVVTGDGVEVVRSLSSEEEVSVALAGFRFQTDTLRHGSARARAHMDVLTTRARK